VPHVFEVEQVLRLLAAAKEDGHERWLLGAVTFIHALRASEAVGLTSANVIGSKLVVKRLKHSNPVEDELWQDENPLLDERQALIDLCRKTRPNQRLFPITSRTFQRWVHRWGARAGLPELYCHPHTLKHSILDYLREKMPLEELQDRSGHKSLDSLRVYMHPKKAVVDQRVSVALKAIPSLVSLL
jgi:integrase